MLFHVEGIIPYRSAWLYLHLAAALPRATFVDLQLDVQAVISGLHYTGKNGALKRSGFHRGHRSCHSLRDVSQLCHLRDKHAFIGFLAVTESALGFLQIQRIDIQTHIFAPTS